MPNYLNGFENAIVEKVVTNIRTDIKKDTLDDETIQNLKAKYIHELKREKIMKEKENLNRRSKNP